jgi:hypothetical protein
MNKSKAYQDGIDVERRIIFLLGLTPSSQDDNIKKDIDAYDKKGSYSIKCQHTALRTGNLAFELEVEYQSGAKSPSWFYTGLADYYLILVGNVLCKMSRPDFCFYIKDTGGWDRVTQLNFKTRQSQKEIGHRHVNATLGLVSLERLERDGILEIQTTLPF